MDSKEEIVFALNKLNFIQLYKDLVNKYSGEISRNFELDNVVVLQLIKELGYSAKYDKRENFFGIDQKIGVYEFSFNIAFNSNSVELIWAVLKNGAIIRVGGPWGAICDYLLGDDCQIGEPIFQSIEELKLILIEAFEVYEKFKSVVLT